MNPFINIDSATKDIFAGIRQRSLWWVLGSNEIRQRYRRSILGPFWLSLSMLVLVVALGVIYGQLFNMEIDKYVPFLAAGLVIWNFMAFLINEGCQTFIASSSYIRQLAIPKSVFAFQVISRNFLIFAHNLVVVVALLIYFNIKPHGSAFYYVPLGLILIMISGFSLAIILGGFSARYRDIPQIVASVVQVLFFITPVMFRGDMLKNHDWLMIYNPFFYYLELVRKPLLGGIAPDHSLMIVSLMTISLVLVAVLFLARFGKRINYWI